MNHFGCRIARKQIGSGEDDVSDTASGHNSNEPLIILRSRHQGQKRSHRTMYASRDRYSPANETFINFASITCQAIEGDSFTRDKKDRTCLLRLEIYCLTRFRLSFAKQYWRSPALWIFLTEHSCMNRVRRRRMCTFCARE